MIFLKRNSLKELPLQDARPHETQLIYRFTMVFQIAYLFSLVVANFVWLRILICCRSQLVCSIEEGFLSSFCWITDGQITHLVVEGLLPPTGIDPTLFQNFCVSEVDATTSDFKISFQCHVIGYTAQKMKFSIADFFSK